LVEEIPYLLFDARVMAGDPPPVQAGAAPNAHLHDPLRLDSFEPRSWLEAAGSPIDDEIRQVEQKATPRLATQLVQEIRFGDVAFDRQVRRDVSEEKALPPP